jgi:YCII-related domain
MALPAVTKAVVGGVAMAGIGKASGACSTMRQLGGAFGVAILVAVAFGPVLDPEDPWGLGLLDLDDEQAAREIGQADPAVQTGTCTYDVVPMELVRPG